MSVYIPEDIKECKKRVKIIETWLNEYQGDNELLINKRLDEQEACLKKIRQFSNDLANRDW